MTKTNKGIDADIARADDWLRLRGQLERGTTSSHRHRGERTMTSRERRKSEEQLSNLGKKVNSSILEAMYQTDQQNNS